MSQAFSHIGVSRPRGFRKPVNPVLDLSHPLSRGLLSCWVLGDSAKGRAIDIGPQGAHMSVASGNPSPVSSHHGGMATVFKTAAIGVDGSYASAPFPITSAQSYSISLWVNPEANSGTNSRWYSKNDTIILYGDGQTSWNATNDGSGTNLTPTLTTPFGAWTHIVITSTPSGAGQFYANGALLASGALGAVPNDTAALYIGDRASTGRPVLGQEEGFRWYSRVLSASEIRQLYAEPYAGIYSAGTFNIVGIAAAAGGTIPTPYFFQQHVARAA